MATRVPKLDLAARFLRKRVKTHENESKKDIKNDSVRVFEEKSNVKDWNILFGLIIFRLCNVFLVQTWHVPDEFWQCPEVAHKMVFGYGHSTWEWQEAIRGYVYPLLFAFAYKILDIFNMDFQILIIYLPRIIQALFGACGEYYVYKTAWLLYGAHVAWWVLFCQVTSWFMFYCITRTLTNSMETALISIALYYWELSQNLKPKTTSEITEQTSAIYKALILASFSCLVRPTALVIWIPLGIARLRRESPVHFFFIYVVPVGICSLIFSVLVDSYFYGKFVLVQYNFLYFNVMKNIGEIYGTHPWHWYITQGIPVVLLSHLVPFGIGIHYLEKSRQKWLLLIGIDVAVFSLLGHKEFRFILPIIPMAMLICGTGMHHIATASSSRSMKKSEDLSSGNLSKNHSTNFKGKLLAVFLILTNAPVALYTGLIHQRGTLDVMQALEEKITENSNTKILFLMPCHSTPYYSYLHMKVEMRFLDCTPSMQPAYIDEADRFYENPELWLYETFNKKQEDLPSHLIFFDVLHKDIKTFLEKHFYTECGRYFYSNFPSGRLGQSVLLFCKAAA